MSLKEDDRVYDRDGVECLCMWFALCPNPANGLRRGPIMFTNGEFGDIPICKRCDDKVERI